MKASQKPKPVKPKDYSKYPFMNLSLEDIPGEEWLDAPGLDGYIKVSNYGRVWSLPRPVYSSDGHFYYTKERIRKQSLAKRFNPYINQYREQLHVHIRYEGKSYNVQVNRLVYSAFVKPVSFQNDKLMIVHLDGDNCNNRWDNLKAMDGTRLYAHDLEINLRALTRTLDKKIKSEGGSDRNLKAIVKYTLEGQKLSEYESIAQAARLNKVHRASIRHVAMKKLRQLHGLVYRFKGDRYKGEYADFSTEKQVTQYSIEGKRIAVYPSVKVASSQCNIHPDTISKCALQKINLAGGFVWRYPGDRYKGEYARKKIKNKAKPLVQYSLEGKIVAHFASVNEAALTTGFTASTLLDCAFKRTRVSHGFVWRFEGESYKGEHKNYRIGKPVTQFSLENRVIQSFVSIEAAARASGLTPDNIYKNVKGDNKSAGGFVWRYASPKEIKKLPRVQPSAHGQKKYVGTEVIQYSPDGKMIAPFASISDAANELKINVSNISAVLDKAGRSAAGYVWRTRGNRYYGELAKRPSANKARVVSQYDLKGRKIQVFNSTFEAESITGVPSTSISMAARGKLKSTGGFIWLYGDGAKKIDVAAHFASTRKAIQEVSKPVLKFSLDGDLMASFPSIAAAARAEGISINRISSAVNGSTKSAAGYVWKTEAFT
jgi:hypothetical protein